jgi:hypothetical protein
MGTLAVVAAGALIAGLLFGSLGTARGTGIDVGLLDLLLGGSGIVVLLIFGRRRHAARARPTRVAVSVSSSVDTPSGPTTTDDHPGGGSSFAGGAGASVERTQGSIRRDSLAMRPWCSVTRRARG